MISVEYNPRTGIAHLSEFDQFMDVRCGIDGFMKIVGMMEDIHGKMSVHNLPNNSIILIKEVI